MLSFCRTLSVLLAGALLLAAGPLWAGSWLGVHGGVALPLQPQGFTDGWNRGFTVGASVLRQARRSPFGMLAGFSVSGFGIDNGLFLRPIDGGSTTITSLYAGGRFSPPAPRNRTRGFVQVAAGFYRITTGTVDVAARRVLETDLHKNAAGLNLGTGLQFRSYIFDLLYEVGFTQDETTSHFALRVGAAVNLSGQR